MVKQRRRVLTLAVGVFATLSLLASPHLAQAQEFKPESLLQPDHGSFPLDAVKERCIASDSFSAESIRDCAVTKFGALGTVADRAYYYAAYCLVPMFKQGTCDRDRTNQYATHQAIAIFEAVSDKSVAALFERSDLEGLLDYSYDPAIVTNVAGALLYLPIRYTGTGWGNGSEYYLRVNARWERVESESWEAEARRRLPRGLEIGKGVWPDSSTLQAETGLYQDGDGNCCPTGGVATIQLEIRAMRFVIKSMSIDRDRAFGDMPARR